jgi:CubicO group peptidase (beta-lactamase class C family)
MIEQFIGPATLGGRALSLNGTFTADDTDPVWNRRELHAAEVPAANGITDASSLAKMYAACVGEVDGVRLLSADYVDRARTTLASGADQCLLADTRFGIGFMTNGPFGTLLGPGSFGHPGAGGSLGAAHPAHEIGFGYIMNQMQMNLADDPRLSALTNAVLSCV